MGALVCPNCGTPVPGAQASTTTTQTAPVSGIDALTKDSGAQDYWLRRFVAFVVDAIIVGIAVAIIGVFAFFALFFAGGFGFSFLVNGLFSFFFGILFVLYFAVFESSMGASIGKRLMGLTVKSKTGSKPGFGEAFVRNISKIYWVFLLLDVIVGLATSKGYQQKYTDHLMGTTVAKA